MNLFKRLIAWWRKGAAIADRSGGRFDPAPPRPGAPEAPTGVPRSLRDDDDRAR